MEFKTIAGIKISILGLGTWHMGGDMSADYSEDNKYIKAIKYAISKGLTHIDTAEIYSGGHAEELVGESIKKFNREKLFITSKVWSTHLSYNNVIKACEQSLKRLKTGYLDLYLIHWPNPLAAFDELKKQGKIKNIGVSNFSVSQLQNAQKYTKSKIVCNQVHYSLMHRNPEEELLGFCQKEDIILTAYTPIEKGRIADSEVLKKVGKKYNRTPIQVAIRYLLEKPNVIVIPKASSKEHID